MNAIQITQVGSPDVLRISEVELPTPNSDQGLIDITVAGVNFIDIYHRSGKYPINLPYIPGVEGIGKIAELGSNSPADLKVGMRVGWVMASGGYAESAVIPAKTLIPIPEDLKDEDAVALLLQGITAHYLTRNTFEVKPGDTAVVHSAAGGVGLLLTRYIKSLGGRVIATASTEEKRAIAIAAGADLAIGYEEFSKEVKEFTKGLGANVIYDGVGKDTFDQDLLALRRRGTLAVFGAASGQVAPIEIMKISAGSIFLTRPTLADYVVERSELLRRANEVFEAFRRGDIQVAIGGRYPLADAASAHRNLEARQTTGKLILQVR
jgi:NADPH2:quinone reductase